MTAKGDETGENQIAKRNAKTAEGATIAKRDAKVAKGEKIAKGDVKVANNAKGVTIAKGDVNSDKGEKIANGYIEPLPTGQHAIAKAMKEPNHAGVFLWYSEFPK